MDDLKKTAETVGGAMGDAARKAADMAEEAAAKANVMAEQAAGKANVLLDGVADKVGPLVDEAKGIAESAFVKAKDAAAGIADSIKKKME